MENITESIIEVKHDNSLLRKEIDYLKITHSKEFEEVKDKIVEEYRQTNEELHQSKVK